MSPILCLTFIAHLKMRCGEMSFVRIARWIKRYLGWPLGVPTAERIFS